MRGRGEEQQQGNDGGTTAATHLLAAIVPELPRFGERNLGGKLNCRINIWPPGVDAGLVRQCHRQQRP
jgi:hypothetical protein